MPRRPQPTAPAPAAVARGGRHALGRTGSALLGIATPLLLTACSGSDDDGSDDAVTHPASGPYPFQATVTWEVSWTGTNNPDPTDLPSGIFGTPQDVTVKEVQSVVR